jgi:hypothetical protein
MLKSLISLSFLLFLLSSSIAKISAQDSYEFGKPYEFTALNADGTKAVTLTITFDMGGAATIKRSEKAVSATDAYSFFYFINSENGEFEPVNDDGKAEYYVVASDPKEYHFISFDAPKAVKYGGKVGAKLKAIIVCNWKSDKSRECAIEYKGNNLTGRVFCVLPDDGKGCTISITDPKGKAQKSSAIMIRAKSVKFVK